MCGLSHWELLIIFAIVLLVFGASRLPQLFKALGQSVRSFKEGAANPDSLEDEEGSSARLQAHEEAQIVEGDQNGDAPQQDRDKS